METLKIFRKTRNKLVSIPLVGDATVEEICLYGRISFVTATDETDACFFGDPYAPDASNFNVYVNEEKVDQPYTSISFKQDDHVVIEAKRGNVRYPIFRPSGKDSNLDCIKSILEPFPEMYYEAESEKGHYNLISLFEGCTKLESIADNLFINNTNINTVARCFKGCTGLTSIPENIFTYSMLQDVSGLFEGCTGLTSIPKNLFTKTQNLRNAAECFKGCTSITTIPNILFYNALDMDTLSSAFEGCSNLTFVPEDLFIQNRRIGVIDRCFYDCPKLNRIEIIFTSPRIGIADNFATCKGTITIDVPEDSLTADSFKGQSNFDIQYISF